MLYTANTSDQVSTWNVSLGVNSMVYFSQHTSKIRYIRMKFESNYFVLVFFCISCSSYFMYALYYFLIHFSQLMANDYAVHRKTHIFVLIVLNLVNNLCKRTYKSVHRYDDGNGSYKHHIQITTIFFIYNDRPASLFFYAIECDFKRYVHGVSFSVNDLIIISNRDIFSYIADAHVHRLHYAILYLTTYCRNEKNRFFVPICFLCFFFKTIFTPIRENTQFKVNMKKKLSIKWQVSGSVRIANRSICTVGVFVVQFNEYWMFNTFKLL